MPAVTDTAQPAASAEAATEDKQATEEQQPNTFTFIGEWKTQEDIVQSRPRMINFLDKLRHMLEEISPNLGVTDPASGRVIIEK